MRKILFIIQKEFLQIFRDKFLRAAIFLIPVIQMLILVYAATFELRQTRIQFVDQDRSQHSARLIHQFAASPFFVPTGLSPDVEAGLLLVRKDKTDMLCVIPPDFDADIEGQGQPKLQLLINAINGSTAELSLSYCTELLGDYSAELISSEGAQVTDAPIVTKTRYWFNSELDYKIYMAPGILAILVTVIGWMLTGMNLVREKETGTIEQLNVTPVRKYEFIAGKLTPFLLIGLFDLAFGLVIARLLFHVPLNGSLFTLFGFTSVYLIAILGIGLFISTISSTQQQVLFVSFFFVMIFVLMSGLFTSVDNMPEWGKRLNIINPMAYFIRVIRMVLLKGSGFSDISREFISMGIYAVFTNTLAVWRYRKTV